VIGYVAAKVGRSVFVVWAAYTLSFVLLYVLPTNAVDLLFDPTESKTLTAAAKAKVEAYYGFDKPPIVQYFDRLWAAIQGHFGNSIHSGTPVWTDILQVMPETLLLAVLALLLALVFAFAIALTASYTRKRWIVTALEALPPAAVSVPVFLVGLVVIQVFSFDLGWFPPLGDQGVATLILPLVTLAIPVSGPIAQLLVKNFDTEASAPYVTTSLTKGATRSWVLSRDVFRNASLPALTIAGITFGNLLAGAVIVETIYSRPGLGRLTQTAVGTKDIPVVQGIVVFTALAFALINLAVDLAYPALDPRLKARILAR
jgi:peptide/nickel transport system permease protein